MTHDWKERDRLTAEQVAADIANPEPGRCRARAMRMADLEHQRRMIYGVVEFAGRKVNRRGQLQRGDTSKVFEREDYCAAVAEANRLHDVQREHAIRLNWPIWQEHQHFVYERGDELRSGEVVSFDVEHRLVAAFTWPFRDVCAELTKHTEIEIVTVDAIERGEERERLEDDASRLASRAHTRPETSCEQPSLFTELSA